MYKQYQYKLVELGMKEEIVNEQAVTVPYLKKIHPVTQVSLADIGITHARVVLSSHTNEHGIMINEEYNFPVDYIENVVIESTTKFDKDGRKIFTSDIVKYNDTLYVAAFIDGGFYISHYKDQISLPLNEDLAKKCERVGNSYENPELIDIQADIEAKLNETNEKENEAAQ